MPAPPAAARTEVRRKSRRVSGLMCLLPVSVILTTGSFSSFKCNAVSADKQIEGQNVMWMKSTPGKRRLATESTNVAKQPNTGPSFEEPNRAEMEEVVHA